MTKGKFLLLTVTAGVLTATGAALAANDLRATSTDEGSLRGAREVRREAVETRAAMQMSNKEEMSAKDRTELRVRAEEQRAEMEQKRKNTIAQRVENLRAHIARIFIRLEAGIQRLVRLEERLTARIDVVKGRGIDTTEAEQYLVEAITKRGDAEVALMNAKSDLLEITAEDFSRDSFANVRETLSETVSLIRETHALLVKSVASLKASVEVGADADSDTGTDTDTTPDTTE